jgi:hypothetical protein
LTIQIELAALACRLRAMVGSATLAIALSSTASVMPSATTRIAQ